MKQFVLTLLFILVSLLASADSVEIDGIWYNLVSKTKTAEVAKKTSGEYSGAIVIPEKVTYNGEEYSVTSIGKGAFYSCKNSYKCQRRPSIYKDCYRIIAPLEEHRGQCVLSFLG